MKAKVGKNDIARRQVALAEILALTVISWQDPNNKSLCIKMLNCCDYDGHICIAFPVLGLSVFDFMKKNKYRPFAMNEVHHIGYQLCIAVSFLHENGITHTDLKPENLLFVFVDSSYTTLCFDGQKIRQINCTDTRLIDFGNVMHDNGHHYATITTPSLNELMQQVTTSRVLHSSEFKTKISLISCLQVKFICL